MNNAECVNLYFCDSFEDVHNGLKYALLDQAYNYTQAAAACAEEGGTLALANDTATFLVLFKLVRKHHSFHGGTLKRAFVDGSKQTGGVVVGWMVL